jgi:small nuclear ribonucleoprotein (snRNP)-like protein
MTLLGVALITIAVFGVARAAISTKTFGDGIHRVGKNDVPAGTYRSRGGDGCYWARLKSFSGDVNAILANANASGPTIVTIKATDKGFQSENCGTWTSNLRRITKSQTRFGEGVYIVRTDITPGTYRSRVGEGVYIVRTDITPGTYRSRGGGSCYWARLRAFTGDLNAIIANGNTSAQTIVTISASDRGFQSQGCGTWSKF